MVTSTQQNTIVLIAESAINNINKLARFLKAEGYQILVAAERKQALAIAITKKPQILLIDFSWAVENEFEICKTLRQHNSDITIFLLTENPDANEVQTAIQMGADECIAKATPYFELLTRLRHVMGEKTNLPKSKTETNYQVLLVEDNELNQEFVSAILNEMGLKLSLVADGLKAIELIKEKNFDLIVTDINVPGLNGLDLSKQAKALRSPALPVIVVSGHAESYYQSQVKEAGINKYLMKPFTARQLREAVTEFLPALRFSELLQQQSVSENSNRKKRYSYKEAQNVAKGDDELFAKWFERFKEVLVTTTQAVNLAIDRNVFERKTKTFHELMNYAGYFGLTEFTNYVHELNTIAQITDKEENIRNFYLKIRAELDSIQLFYKDIKF